MSPSVDLDRRILRGEVRMAGDATRRLRDSLLRTTLRSAGVDHGHAARALHPSRRS